MFDSELSKVYAELNILGADIDAQDISKKLGMEIDYVRKEKDYSAQKNNSVSVNPARSNKQYTIWTYKAEEKSTVNINERLDELILVFRNKVKELNDIEDKYDCQINICIVIYNRQKCLPGMDLRQDQIDFLAKIRASIDFDIYITVFTLHIF